jgi:hypothetical protein
MIATDFLRFSRKNGRDQGRRVSGAAIKRHPDG